MPIRDLGWWTAPGLSPRPITVWIPSYPHSCMSVLYAHDGQNLFHPEQAFGGVDWGLQHTLESMIGSGKARPTMIVGLGNTPERLEDYAPGERGEAYLRFLVEDLMPQLSRHFPVSPLRHDHFLLGSSMGGIISACALCLYPEYFGGAACLSTHWTYHDGSMIEWLQSRLRPPGRHRWYFDYGDQTADAPYAAYQKRVDEMFRERGYRQGQDIQTLSFPGADHSERAWRARVHLPLHFLLG